MRSKKFAATLASGNAEADMNCYLNTNHNHNNNELFSLKVTKMKRSSNKDAKLGDKYLKHLTLKSIRVSFANLFKPSKRMGRNQPDMFIKELQDFSPKYVAFNQAQCVTPISTTTHLNFAASAQVLSFPSPRFAAIDNYNFAESSGEKKSLRRQSNILGKPLTTRSTTLSNVFSAASTTVVFTSAKQECLSNPSKLKQIPRKAQPSMGVKAIEAKTSKTKAIKQLAPLLPPPPPITPQTRTNRQLVPFLDSIENLLPISSSTFIEPAKKTRAYAEKQQTNNPPLLSTSSSLSCVCSGTHSQISSATLSPISTRSTRKQCVQLRSISVMNVSSVMSSGTQF